nr:reverse transcriptase domain, reverse transcriptase zinc-binding domain protein [Tanacetum cinerariifolium]
MNVPEQFVLHFQKFLGTSVPVQFDTSNLEPVAKVTLEEANYMVRNVFEEIKQATFDIDDNKAPGPYGFTSKFFKKAWEMMFALPPKSSFIVVNFQGRQITDNILLAQELLKGYDWKNGAKRVSFKIDIQKAYDIVNWEFLRKFLGLFGFHEKMIHWIMTCVCTAFSIAVNGERFGYFNGGRGMRQWDPRSCYLFTLVMEIFNLILKQKIRECQKFMYHWGCKEMEISSLCFADDLLVLFHGDVKESSRKGQNRIKTGHKREAWRSREKSKAVTVDRARKTEQNGKRRAENAYTVKSYSSLKKEEKKKGLILHFQERSKRGVISAKDPELYQPRTSLAINI